MRLRSGPGARHHDGRSQPVSRNGLKGGRDALDSTTKELKPSRLDFIAGYVPAQMKHDGPDVTEVAGSDPHLRPKRVRIVGRTALFPTVHAVTCRPASNRRAARGALRPAA
jgi:hypothetical protein